MQRASLPPPSPRRNGNDAAYPAPFSRRAFLRSAPGRLNHVEDLTEALASRLDEIEFLLPNDALAMAVTDAAAHGRQLAAGLAALVAIINKLNEHIARSDRHLGRVDRRSLRTRRKLATVAAQVETALT
jgi:hypothetical protein